MNNQQKTLNNRHAVVIGASMAGLLAARVLSDHFEQVTIIERDRLSDQVEPRKGVPQGRHVHILLAKGESILREYFPDFYATFTQDGAIPLTTSDIRWFDSGLWKTAAPEPIKSHSAGRPFLETYVRRFLAERANVRFIDGCEVSRLNAGQDHKRVTGVTLLHSNPQRYKEIASHLPRNVKPFMFGSYPSSLFLSDIPVQGVAAALKQAQKQRHAASQLHVPAASTEYAGFAQVAGEEEVGASHAGKMEREGMVGQERELQTSQK